MSRQAETLFGVLEEEFGETLDYSRCLVDIFNSSEARTDLIELAGLTLQIVIERHYERISEREVDSFEKIKGKLLCTFGHQNGVIRKLASVVMTKMLIAGGYYSWGELVDFFLETIEKAGGEDEVVQSQVEFALEAIAVLIENFSKNKEDEAYFH